MTIGAPMSYLNKYSPLHPHQQEPLDEQQIQNSAGGYSYPVSIWINLDRFLILGTEGGSYYAGERDLTKENVDSVKQCRTKTPQHMFVYTYTMSVYNLAAVPFIDQSAGTFLFVF